MSSLRTKQFERRKFQGPAGPRRAGGRERPAVAPEVPQKWAYCTPEEAGGSGENTLSYGYSTAA